MHEMLVREYVSKVRERVKQGDCPIEPALSVELLEELVVQLADDLVSATPTKGE